MKSNVLLTIGGMVLLLGMGMVMYRFYPDISRYLNMRSM